eukprot:TRINITY_DN3085_c1_g1_i1.p1 TRINITY_DN3085_c1_g1~~TRINITY_DN3085_c1_g1_i1.p1  ORF type:complete len:838 (-),score=203.33 TRINITY_DN3085_c1_g1_i1:68-2581(-)
MTRRSVMRRDRRTQRVAIAAGLAALLGGCPRGHARIMKHEIVDGKFQEVECTNLEDCIQKGFSTPGILMHRSWMVDLVDAMRQRELLRSNASGAAALGRQRQLRQLLRRRLLRAAPASGNAEPPAFRLLRRFVDEERGVEVTKLLFEAWPGQVVPAVLLEPLGAREAGRRLPGILHLPGHLAAGLRHPEEQQLSLGLAQRGYVVLSFDPLSQGERQQYVPSARQPIECALEPPGDGAECVATGPPCSRAHDHYGKQLWLLGRSAAELFVRDAQRALDLLAALPYVDGKRLGAVGCSGGGMLTAYLAAVDGRVAAACVACYFSTLQSELEVGTCNYDAEQILWNQAKLGIDKPDLLAARAPKPTMVLLTSHDCFPLSGGRQGFEEAGRTFQAHGRGGDGLYASEAFGHHEVTVTGLRAMQDFFRNQLGGYLHVQSPRNTDPIPCGRLWFGREELERGVSNAPPSPMHRHLRILARPLLARLRVRRWRARNALRTGDGNVWLRSLKASSMKLAGVEEDALTVLHRALDHGIFPDPKLIWKRYYGFGIEEWFLLTTRSSCAVTLRVYRRFSDVKARDAESNGTASSGRSAPIAVLVGGGALLNRELRKDEDLLVGELLHRGFTVVVAGLCGLGDDQWRGGLWQFAPLLLGRTHVGSHAGELLQVSAWARAVLGAERLIFVARGGASAAVLHAALQLPPQLLAGLVLFRSIARYSDVATARRQRMPWHMQMHGVLERYDLPDLLAALAIPPSALARGGRGGRRSSLARERRRNLRALVVEPLGSSRRPLRRRWASKAYDLASQLFAATGQRLRLLTQPRSEEATALAIATFAAAAARSGAA